MNKKIVAGIGAAGGAIALLAGGQVFVSHVAAKEVDKAIENVSEFVEVDYTKVKASLLGGGTKVKGITVSPVGSDEKYNVDEVVVYRYDEKDQVPTHIDVAVNGMALDMSSTGESPLAEIGYDDNLSIDFATEYRYDEAEKEIRLQKFKLGADEMGDLNVSLHLSNISLDAAARESMPFSLLGAVFHEAKITYKDDSLFTRIYDTAAAASGVSVDELKAEAIASLKEDLAQGEEGLSQDLVNEMTNFINDPDSFTFTLEPKEPVPMTALMATSGDPEAIIELLNVRFES